MQARRHALQVLGHAASARRVLASLVLLAVAPGTFAQGAEPVVGPVCGDPFTNHFGPYDYRTAPAGTRVMVERPHFPPGVETLTKPSKTMFSHMGQDIAYTLHVFPNHPRALLTMARAAIKFRNDPAPGALYTVECYFHRGVQFRPDDTVVRALYAQYLAQHKRNDEAARQLALAAEFAKDNPLSHYNIGLVYFEMGDFDHALAQVHKALALGFAPPELVDKLKAANKWVEPGS